MKPSRILIGISLIVLLIGLTLLLFHPKKATTVGAWSLSTTSGGSTGLKDFDNQVRLLNFWASWCGTCREEMPDLVTLKSDYNNRPFSILSINFGEGRDTARQFAISYGATFPVLLDPEKKVATSYGVVTIPTSLLLDKNGKVIKTWVGQISPAAVKTEINRLLQ